MTDSIKSFTQLVAWRKSHQLVLSTLRRCEDLPSYNFLRKQIERSVLSITSNIAEGFGRESINDKKHFYVVARGSAFEVQNQLLVARDAKLLKEAEFQELAELSLDSLRLLHGLIRSLNKVIKANT